MNYTNKEKEILNNIKHYIIYKLPHIIDDQIFNIENRKELGIFYYNNILKNVKGANEDLVKIVIDKICRIPSTSKKKSYYEMLLKHMCIEYMPKERYEFVKTEFNKIFVKELQKLRNAYKKKSQELNTKINKVNKDLKNNIFEAKKAYENIEEDLEIYIKKEHNLLSERGLLETQKEVIDFLHEDVLNKAKIYCEENNILNHSTGDIIIKHTKKILEIDKKRYGGFEFSISLLKTKNEGLKIDKKLKKIILKTKALELSKEPIEPEILKKILGKEDLEVPINTFQYYKLIIERALNIIENPERLNYITVGYVHSLVANKKSYFLYAQDGDLDKANKQYERDMKIIPRDDKLIDMKQNSLEDYLEHLKKIITTDKIVAKIEELINNENLFNIRKRTIIELLELYKDNKFNAFVAGAPSQIEGMFYDWLRDITRYDSFNKLKTFSNELLKDKIKEIIKNDNYVETTIMLYYYTYFNNLVRNRSAHGKLEYIETNNMQILANEILLDLYTLMFISNEFYEIKYMKMSIDAIANEKNNKVAILKHYLYGAELILYNRIIKIQPMQFVYWLINPYYNNIYKNIGYKDKLNSVKYLFFKKDVWENILNEINKNISWNYKSTKITKEFINAVCKIKTLKEFDNETKNILGDIIKKGNQLLKISIKK